MPSMVEPSYKRGFTCIIIKQIKYRTASLAGSDPDRIDIVLCTYTSRQLAQAGSLAASA